MKNSTYYFFDGIIKKNNLTQIKLKQMKSQKILIYYIGWMTIKDLESLESYSVNPLYVIINKVNECFEEINEYKYLTLVPINESKEKIKRI